MPLYLREPRPIGICDRCGQKFYLDQLRPDGDNPGLLVCDADNDRLDPHKLPARKTEQIAVRRPRPDTPLE